MMDNRTGVLTGLNAPVETVGTMGAEALAIAGEAAGIPREHQGPAFQEGEELFLREIMFRVVRIVAPRGRKTPGGMILERAERPKFDAVGKPCDVADPRRVFQVRDVVELKGAPFSVTYVDGGGIAVAPGRHVPNPQAKPGTGGGKSKKNKKNKGGRGGRR